MQAHSEDTPCGYNEATRRTTLVEWNEEMVAEIFHDVLPLVQTRATPPPHRALIAVLDEAPSPMIKETFRITKRSGQAAKAAWTCVSGSRKQRSVFELFSKVDAPYPVESRPVPTPATRTPRSSGSLSVLPRTFSRLVSAKWAGLPPVAVAQVGDDRVDRDDVLDLRYSLTREEFESSMAARSSLRKQMMQRMMAHRLPLGQLDVWDDLAARSRRDIQASLYVPPLPLTPIGRSTRLSRFECLEELRVDEVPMPSLIDVLGLAEGGQPLKEAAAAISDWADPPVFPAVYDVFSPVDVFKTDRLALKRFEVQLDMQDPPLTSRSAVRRRLTATHDILLDGRQPADSLPPNMIDPAEAARHQRIETAPATESTVPPGRTRQYTVNDRLRVLAQRRGAKRQKITGEAPQDGPPTEYDASALLEELQFLRTGKQPTAQARSGQVLDAPELDEHEMAEAAAKAAAAADRVPDIDYLTDPAFANPSWYRKAVASFLTCSSTPLRVLVTVDAFNNRPLISALRKVELELVEEEADLCGVDLTAWSTTGLLFRRMVDLPDEFDAILGAAQTASKSYDRTVLVFELRSYAARPPALPRVVVEDDGTEVVVEAPKEESVTVTSAVKAAVSRLRRALAVLGSGEAGGRVDIVFAMNGPDEVAQIVRSISEREQKVRGEGVAGDDRAWLDVERSGDERALQDHFGINPFAARIMLARCAPFNDFVRGVDDKEKMRRLIPLVGKATATRFVNKLRQQVPPTPQDASRMPHS